jgi:hypothetical protein
MPSTVTISGAQRQVLRELVLDHLNGIGDIVFAVERERYFRAFEEGAMPESACAPGSMS